VNGLRDFQGPRHRFAGKREERSGHLGARPSHCSATASIDRGLELTLVHLRAALDPELLRLAVKLLFCALTAAAADYPTIGQIERTDPALDAIIPKDAKIEKLAEGYTWSEGPVWREGTLLFSDVPENIVYQWKPGATKADVEKAMQGHVLGTADLVGLYQRQPK